MGMGSVDAHLLIRLRKDGHLSSNRRVVEIGAQQFIFTAGSGNEIIIRKLKKKGLAIGDKR